MSAAREAFKFAVPLALVALVVGILVHPVAAVPAVALLVFVLWFFRDPERVSPREDCLLVSPADGKVIRSAEGRISVFMSVFNVHVCRSPVSGTVEELRYESGRFMAAFRDAASEHNERASLVIVGNDGRMTVTLVAGIVARRIVLWVREGQRLRRGQRIGLIRFGSRVDVGLPDTATLSVKQGERVRAGVSVIAGLDGGNSAG